MMGDAYRTFKQGVQVCSKCGGLPYMGHRDSCSCGKYGKPVAKKAPVKIKSTSEEFDDLINESMKEIKSLTVTKVWSTGGE